MLDRSPPPRTRSEFDAAAPGVPTLVEGLALLAQRAGVAIHLDLKGERLEQRLVESVTWPRRALRPVVWAAVAVLRRPPPFRIEGFLRAAGARTAMLHFAVVSPAAVRRCHAAGAAVLVWTVNDERMLQSLARRAWTAVSPTIRASSAVD